MVIFFVQIMLIIAACLTLLVGGANRLGEILSPPAAFIEHNTCTLPCVYGVTPGETDVEQARVIVEHLSDGTFSDSPLDGGSLVFQMERDNFSVFAMMALDIPASTRIRSIGLIPREAGDVGRLGDIMAAGLSPTYVYRTCDPTIPLMLIGFGTESRVVAEFALPPRLRPETPITFLRTYHDKGNTLGEAMISFGCLVETGWHGFVPRWVYLAARPPI
jgi:hypothetical protein